MDYPVTLERDHEGNVVVRFPDFPDAQATGPYEVDALRRAGTALTGALAACIRASRPLPTPSTRPELMRVDVPLLADAKLVLYGIMRTSGIGRAELARRLRWHRPQVDRVLDVRHQSRLDQVDAALRALGYRITVRIEAVENPASPPAIKARVPPARTRRRG